MGLLVIMGFVVLTMFVYHHAAPLGKAVINMGFIILNMFSLAIYIKSGDIFWSGLCALFIVLLASSMRQNWALHVALKSAGTPR